MNRVAIRSANLFVAALVVGTIFGISLGFNPAPLSAGAYVEQQQQAIRSLNVIMPALGALATLLTIANALTMPHRTAPVLLWGAALCFVAAGLVTRFENQPINRQVMTWSAQAPPSDWQTARDSWWRWHLVRTTIGLVGLALVTVGSTMSGQARRVDVR